MTSKVKGLVIALVVTTFVVGNCTSIGHGATMKNELAVKSDIHTNVARPVEFTHEIRETNVSGEAEAMIIWIPFVFDAGLTAVGLVGKVGGAVLGGVGGAVSAIPVVGKKAGEKVANGANTVSNLGPILANAYLLPLSNEAENKAIYANNIDGILRTNVEASISIEYLIFKNYKVKVTGKPVIVKNIGPMSDSRLAKIQTLRAVNKYIEEN
ncbi:MAG: hypothetical protein MH321_11685 [Leptospiraceae bacterium]|nr:hypothetical protein [Leptospiraceae bacterium]